uniref:Uncharacterized protein n=1 Tax=Sphaerodactylus townsendi TaxID=933632 RepID=A0ACB8FRX5_9SAUR
MCAILINSSGPFSECHWYTSPDPYYKSCVYDLCQYGLSNRMLCTAIEAYDEMCTIVGVKMLKWRRALGCGSPDSRAIGLTPAQSGFALLPINPQASRLAEVS